MKKFLSAVLAVAMLMTVLFVVPAQAAVAKTTPYFFEDFESGAISDYGIASGSIDYAEGGAGGSSRALEVTVPSSKTGNAGSVQFFATMPAKNGDVLKFSSWVKIDDELVSGRSQFVMEFQAVYQAVRKENGEVVETKNKTNWPKATINVNYTIGAWSYVTGTYTLNTAPPALSADETSAGWVYDDTTNYTILQVRPRPTTNNSVADLVSATGDFVYYMDDFRLEKVAGAEDTSVPMNAVGTNIVQTDKVSGNFDNLTTGVIKRWVTGSGWSGWADSTVNAEIKEYDAATDPAPDAATNASNKKYFYLPVHGVIDLDRNQNDARPVYQLNHTYKISYWVKPVTTDTTTKYAPCLLLRYDTLKTLADYNTATNNGASPASSEGVKYDTAHNNASLVQYQPNIVIEPNKWNYVEYYYTNEYRGFYEQKIATAFRLYTRNPETGAMTGTFQGTSGLSICYDEVKIEDLGSISNGGFEIGAVPYAHYCGTSAAAHPILSWTAPMPVSQTDDVRPGAAAGSKALLVDATETGGKVTQGISMSPNNRYKISFWAKGIDLASSLPIDIVLGRDIGDNLADGTQQADEQYVVPDYQTIAGPGEVYNTSVTVDIQKNQTWRLTNEWQKYEGVIDTAFPLAAGKTGTLTAVTAMPRQPLMDINVNGGNKGIKYILDDVSIECIGAADAPYVVSAAATGSGVPGVDAGVTYKSLNGGIATTDASYVRLVEKVGSNYVSVGVTAAAGATIEIPESAIGKTLALEFIPMNSDGVVAESVYFDLPAGNWAKIYVDAELASKVYASEATAAKLIYAAYTKDGETMKLVDSSIVDATPATAYPATPITKPADFDTTGATIVKVMLWDGLTNVTPLCEFVEVDLTAAE